MNSSEISREFSLPMIDYTSVDGKGNIKISFWLKYLLLVGRHPNYENIPDKEHLKFTLYYDQSLKLTQSPYHLMTFLSKPLHFTCQDIKKEVGGFDSLCTKSNQRLAQLSCRENRIDQECLSSRDLSALEHSLEFPITCTDTDVKNFATKAFLVDCCVCCAQEADNNDFYALLGERELSKLNVDGVFISKPYMGDTIKVEMYSKAKDGFQKCFFVHNLSSDVDVCQIAFDISMNSKL